MSGALVRRVLALALDDDGAASAGGPRGEGLRVLRALCTSAAPARGADAGGRRAPRRKALQNQHLLLRFLHRSRGEALGADGGEADAAADALDADVADALFVHFSASPRRVAAAGAAGGASNGAAGSSPPPAAAVYARASFLYADGGARSRALAFRDGVKEIDGEEALEVWSLVAALQPMRCARAPRPRKPVEPGSGRSSGGMKLRGPRFSLSPSLSIKIRACLLYTSPSPRDRTRSRMPSSA